MSRQVFLQIYHSLLKHHGPQYWWPADSPFEVMVGAILVQNTSWSNVEKAIATIKQTGALDPAVILEMSEKEVAALIHSVGYFNVKARRLRNYCQWYLDADGYDKLDNLTTKDLRERLLGINGIGPETADDILLYAFNRSVFVIDAYTRRVFSRLDLLAHDLGYEAMRSQFETVLDDNVDLFNEYHALIDVHAAKICKKKPLCSDCCLIDLCQFENE